MSPHLLTRAGQLGVVAGVLGALSAVVLLVWPAQVADNLVSYPLTPRGFYVAQAWFFVQHLGLVVVTAALAARAARTSRVAPIGAWIAVAGLVALSFTELLTMRYASWDDEAAYAGLMGTAYGLSVNLVGVGLLVAGVGVVRAGAWSGWRRWVPLAIGIATFAVVTPGMFAGFVVARLAIGSWMLLFAALGWGMVVESRRSPAGAHPRSPRDLTPSSPA